MGRYPWIVQGLLRISEGLSKTVTADQVMGSIILFGLVYSFLFILFIYLLNEKIQHGPVEGITSPLFRGMQQYVKESSHESVK